MLKCTKRIAFYELSLSVCLSKKTFNFCNYICLLPKIATRLQNFDIFVYLKAVELILDFHLVCDIFVKISVTRRLCWTKVFLLIFFSSENILHLDYKILNIFSSFCDENFLWPPYNYFRFQYLLSIWQAPRYIIFFLYSYYSKIAVVLPINNTLRPLSSWNNLILFPRSF